MPISDQVMRDLRDVASMIRNALRTPSGEYAVLNESAKQLVYRLFPTLVDEVESLRDSTLAKDFLALYQAARMVTSAAQTSAPSIDVEGLGLHVVRLAPLYDDVRMRLNLRSAMARDAARPALGGPLPRRTSLDVHSPLPFVLRGAVAARPLERQGVDPVPARPGPDVDREGVDPFERHMLLREFAERLAFGPAPIAGEHTVRVQQLDGSVSVECNHTFKGTTRCVHCGKPFAELRAEALTALTEMTELARLQPQLPDGVLHATPDELARVVQQQLDEHQGAGILPEPELAVPITLGSSLRPRVEAIVATGRLGDDIERVVQTLFVLGMLDAEGQDPEAHVGEPHMHVSAEALFVRFGLPHEGSDAATRQRRAILRRLMLDLAEWCDGDDPLRPAFAAALEALPR